MGPSVCPLDLSLALTGRAAAGLVAEVDRPRGEQMAYKDQSRGPLPNVSYVCIDGLAAATSRIDQVHGRTGKKITE